jgi:epoxyqueuosine reductase
MQPSIGPKSSDRDPAATQSGRPRPGRLAALTTEIRAWGLELGFQQVGIADTDLGPAEARLADWLRLGFQGEMGFMSRHGTRRSRPAELIPGTLRVISARMDYLPEDHAAMQAHLSDPAAAFVSRYSLGRDYHKLLRRRLQHLADRIAAAIGPFGYRVVVDSAPVLEKPLAEKAGLGWIGKHTNLINRQAGSWFFLGEIYTDLPLPVDTPAKDHCGTCQACMAACPTRAIVAPYVLDARLCISYLTIELRGPIPEPLRPLIGNRIYGCDDCQLACPWNRFARLSCEADFGARWDLDTATLIDLFAWDEAQFLRRTEGSAIRRIGHLAWLRNLAVALGNAPTSPAAVAALAARLSHPSSLVREHVRWALERQANPTRETVGVRPAAAGRGSGAAPRWTP